MAEEHKKHETPENGDNSYLALIRNPISLVGAALAVVSLANVIFLFLVDVFSAHSSPYIGILAYMIMPGLLVAGMALIPVGMFLARKRREARGVTHALPRIDLNLPKQRSALVWFLCFVIVFVVLSAVGGYRAYRFTDSVAFCGQLCHGVMKPEFEAYKQSPHARVACVECHVGEGAGWYVRSKLSGSYQLYAVAFNKYPRPIPTPVQNLRPAQETCEQCHWPRRFVGDQFKTITHYGNDEKNTPRHIRLLIRTGGGDPSTGMATGIHWHMNIGSEVTYAQTDPQRQQIDWIQTKNLQTGEITVYKSADAKQTDAEFAKAPRHRMDCIDCHSRPSHTYVPPDRSVDRALLAAKLDPSMPFIKQQAVTALTGDYKTTEEANQGIYKTLHDFYAKYPKVTAPQLNAAVAEVQAIYSTTIFPEMKVDWRTHPDNIGHFYFPGCFRCHDGQHVSTDGKKKISNSCTVCHVVLGQDEGRANAALANKKFEHPGGPLPDGAKCMDCHTGGVGP